MSDIALARKLLVDLLDRRRRKGDHELVRELSMVLPLLDREPPIHPPAPRRSRAATPELYDAIRRYKRANPDASIMEIGVRFHVASGRASEAFHRLDKKRQRQGGRRNGA